MELSDKCVIKERLASLDVLRGFDLFLLVFFQPVFVAFARQADCGWLQPILYQLDHEVWEGFRFWDLVMPLFLFMTGVSMPFSFSKYERTNGKAALYPKIIRRFILLFLLGMIVQGNLLGLDWSHIYFYNNTLQAIATGYLFAALILLHFSVGKQLFIGLALLVTYSVPFILTGDFSLESNFARRVDECVMGRFMGDSSYSWIWSSMTFTVTVLLGTFAGRLMKRGGTDKRQTVLRLLLIGAVLVVAAFCISPWLPVNKRIWSASMTLLSGGYCFLLMGVFYYWIDYRGHIKGLGWLRYYGMNSITAYVLGEVVNFRSVAHSVCYGLQPYLADYYSAFLTLMNFTILFLILRWMYKRQVFLKI